MILMNAEQRRKVISAVRDGFSWISAETSRAIIIYSLLLITAAYLAAGLWLAFTKSYWKASDTFSMIAGFVFFVIGTSLAITHEIRQEEQKEIITWQGTIMTGQSEILNQVREFARKTYEHLNPAIAGLPANKREVSTQHEATTAVTIPAAEPVPSPQLSPADRELLKLQDPSPSELVLESLRVHETPGEKLKALQRFALESAIEARSDTTAVQNLLKPTQLFALGNVAGDTSVPGHGTESDILHFTIDESQGKERAFMPLFTRFDVLRDALLRNPDWQKLQVLDVNGGDLIANRDSDVTIVVNPWSKLEWRLYPPTGPVT